MVGILDWSVIIIYMLSMVVVGVYFKTNDNMTDFAVADKKLDISVLTATLLATAVGGGALTGSVGNGYASGLLEVPKIIILLGINVFMALFVAKQMRNIGGFTAPEMLGRVYGKKCQVLGGIFCAIYMIGTGPAMQSIALGSCIHLLLGVDMRVGMIIGMAVILGYTMSSGMWGVAMTDYVQFIFLSIGVLITAGLIYHEAGGWTGITAAVPADHMKIDTTGAIKLLCATSLPVLIDGNRYSRFFSAKDGNTARFSTLIASIPQSMILLMSLVMGLAAVNILPANTPKDMVFSSLLINYVPTGIKGLSIAALMAAIMSTADSYMLAGATNISVDIYKTYINPNASDKQMVYITKAAVIGVGLVGLAFALILPDLISVWTLSGSIYVGGCLVPMLYGIFSKRRKSYTAAIAAIVAGGGLSIIMEVTGTVIYDLPPVVYGIIVSAIVMAVITPFAKDAKFVDIRK